MLTWKVWTDDDSPVFEGTEEQGRAYIVARLLGCLDAVLESPDEESFGYQDGIWVSLDGAWSD